MLEQELSPDEMQRWCSEYTKTYDGMVPPMWKAAYDDNVPAMKSLYYFYKRGVDGFDASNREDQSMPTHICCLRGHVDALEWLATLRYYDGRPVVNFNLRDDGGHTPLWLAAAWGWEKSTRFLLTLPSVHPCIPDDKGVTPEEAARKVGFHDIADAIHVRAEEMGVLPVPDSYWDEPDKRWYQRAPEEEEEDEDDDME